MATFMAARLQAGAKRRNSGPSFAMLSDMRLWIKDPIAILADNAASGLVVDGTRIVELVPRGGKPSTPVDATFDASRHVIIPGLVNTHHHFFQTLTRAHPAAINKELFPWLRALYPIWAKNVTPDA